MTTSWKSHSLPSQSKSAGLDSNFSFIVSHTASVAPKYCIISSFAPCCAYNRNADMPGKAVVFVPSYLPNSTVRMFMDCPLQLLTVVLTLRASGAMQRHTPEPPASHADSCHSVPLDMYVRVLHAGPPSGLSHSTLHPSSASASGWLHAQRPWICMTG